MTPEQQIEEFEGRCNALALSLSDSNVRVGQLLAANKRAVKEIDRLTATLAAATAATAIPPVTP
jgi:hypothetical protein